MAQLDLANLDLIEPVPAAEIHADGIAFARVMDGELHMLLYADMIGVTGEVEHHVTARVIMPADRQPEGRLLIEKAIHEAAKTRIANAN